MVSCSLYYLGCFPPNTLPDIYILLEEGFLLPTLVSPTHRMVPGTQYIQERERRIENWKKTPDSKHSPIWWWSFSLLLIQPEMIFTLLKPCLWTYYNLTVHKIHIVLPSHMFTIYTGTSGNPYSTEIHFFLNGPIPPARAEFWTLNQVPTERAPLLQVSCDLDQDTIQRLARAHVS